MGKQFFGKSENDFGNVIPGFAYRNGGQPAKSSGVRFETEPVKERKVYQIDSAPGLVTVGPIIVNPDGEFKWDNHGTSVEQMMSNLEQRSKVLHSMTDDQRKALVFGEEEKEPLVNDGKPYQPGYVYNPNDGSIRKKYGHHKEAVERQFPDPTVQKRFDRGEMMTMPVEKKSKKLPLEREFLMFDPELDKRYQWVNRIEVVQGTVKIVQRLEEVKFGED